MGSTENCQHCSVPVRPVGVQSQGVCGVVVVAVPVLLLVLALLLALHRLAGRRLRRRRGRRLPARRGVLGAAVVMGAVGFVFLTLSASEAAGAPVISQVSSDRFFTPNGDGVEDTVNVLYCLTANASAGV